MRGAFREIAERLGIRERPLRDLDETMATITGRHGVVERLYEANRLMISRALEAVHVTDGQGSGVRKALAEHLAVQEERLAECARRESGDDEFVRAAGLARRIARVEDGWFLRRSFIANALGQFPPKNLLRRLGYPDAATMAAREDATEIMSALRFIESDEWMHEFFRRTYGTISEADFETRPIEIKVLGPRWRDVAEQFVAKKHHNVSHLKEFGVIFINPIAEAVPGKFIRDFALLLHYFHEIAFYAKLFRRAVGTSDFAERIQSFLRGDVREAKAVALQQGKRAEWLIVQRYLVKENAADPRLALPRVNPESLHWRRAERDLAAFGREHSETRLAMWENLDWVGMPASAMQDRMPLSFDLEDNAMSLVSLREGAGEYFSYHAQEALWTELCVNYAGGEAELDRLVLDQFSKGVIRFEKQ